jgi:hypothetical protein
MAHYWILLCVFFLIGGGVGLFTIENRLNDFHPEDRHNVRYFRTTEVRGTALSQTGDRVLVQPFQPVDGTPLPPLELRITDATELAIVTEKTSVDGFTSSEQVATESLSLVPGDTVRAFFDRDTAGELTAYIMRKIEVQKI